MTFDAPKDAPAEPTNLKTNGDEAEYNYTTLSWNAVDYVTGYELRYTTDVDATDSEANWKTVETVVAADVTEFTTDELDLAYGTEYKFQVRALRVEAGAHDRSVWDVASDWSDACVFQTVEAPEPPTDLKASVLAPETLTVDLSWGNLDNELGYEVKLLDADGAVVAQSDRLAADTTTWTTPALELGTTYQFQVTAYNNAAVNGVTSEPFSFTTENVPTVQPVLTATVAPSTTAPTATLKWGAVETATRYVVEQLVVDGETATWTAVQTFENGETEWTTAVEANAAYSYRVVAANAYGSGVPSEAVAFTPDAASTVVTTLDDVVDPADGLVSLREAIQYAEVGATVTFAETLKGETLKLGGTCLQIDKAIAIDGSFETGAPQITIDADAKSRVFNVEAGTADAPVKLVGLTITNGYADVVDNRRQYGGGIRVGANAALDVANSKIVGNRSTERGGGVYLNAGSTGNFTNVEITGNVGAFYGGGVAVGSNASATFRNSTVIGLSNLSNQVGIDVDANSGAVKFYNSIVQYVGARQETQTLEAYNTASDFTGWTNADEEGVVNYVIDETLPLFTDAENSDYTLADGSQALNKGDNAYVPETLTTDLAGNPRLSGRVDLGAYEFQGVATTAPTGLTATVNPSTAPTATLKWDAVVSDAIAETVAGYEVTLYQIVVDADGETTVVAFEPQTVTDATYTTETLDLGGTYYFEVAAVNAYGKSEVAKSDNFTVGTVPTAPTGLTATVLNPETLTVDLTWIDVAGNQNGYVVETLVDGAWVAASEETLAANTRTWTTGKLELGTTYAYRVAAVNDYGQSAWATVEFTTKNVPTTPTGLAAVVNASTEPTATLSWLADQNATAYEVTLYQTVVDADGETTIVAFEPQTVTDATYTTGTLDFGGTYYFEVAAVNAYGKSEVEKSDNFTVGTVPPTPTDLFATVDASFKATLFWTDAAKDEAGYRVELQTQNADGETVWTTVATLDADATTWTSDALTSGETYQYRVVAFNAYGAGGAAETSVTLEAASTVVTTLADVVNPADNLISLREAIQYAEAGDVVTFDNKYKGGTIQLHGTCLQIDKAITIDGAFGTGSPYITVDGYGTSGVFNVVAGTTDAPVAFVGLKITRGVTNGGVIVVNGSATFTNVEITGNKAFQGGGVHLVNSSATFTNVKIAGNEAERGGGVFAFQNSTATFTNVEIADNVATQTGGGAFVYGNSTATFTNVAIVDNSATGAGGGVVLDGPSSATFTNATIAGNSAENGAAVLLNTPFFPNQFSTTFYNSIVDGEIARGDSSPDARANAYNTLSTFTEWTNQATAETDGIYLLAEGDSLFAEGSYALAADSVARDKGDNAYVPETLTTDLAGNARIVNDAVDLGAYESPEAASTVVTTNADVVDAYDGEISIREALAYAKSGQTVTFAESLRGKTITLAGEELTIDKMLTIQGLVDENGAPQITIDADGKSRVFNINAGVASKPVNFSGLTVTGGAATNGGAVYIAWGKAANFTNVAITNSAATNVGGGVYVRPKAVATFANVELTGNVATNYGGGVYAEANSVAHFENSTLSGNQADFGAAARVDGNATFKNNVISENNATNYAGAVFVGKSSVANFEGNQISDNVAARYSGAIHVSGTANFESNQITGNTAAARDGGAVYVDGAATFVNDEIAGNVATRNGGALYVVGTATLTNATIAGNQAVNGAGAYVANGGTANFFEDAALSGNKATNNGGGAYVANGGTANFFEDAALSENKATNGAAAYIANGGTANFKGANLTGNIATNYGGGVYAEANSVANFENSTLSGNQADFGAAARVDGNATFKNNVISENNATNYAGAVFVGKSSVANFEGNQISDNVAARYSGAIHVSGTATFKDNKITGNTAAARDGGAVYVDGAATFVNDEITGNVATRNGGALYVNGTATLTNATIAGNQAVNGAGAYVANGGTANFKDSTIEDAVVGNVVISDSSDETPISAAFADAFDELDFFVDEDELDALAQRLI